MSKRKKKVGKGWQFLHIRSDYRLVGKKKK